MLKNQANPDNHQQCSICEELLKNLKSFFSLLDSTNNQSDIWLTVDEVASELKVSRSIIYRLIRNGELESVNIAETEGKISQKGHYRIKRQSLENYLKDRTTSQHAEPPKKYGRCKRFPKVKNHLGL
jgi:excisionase family DNA binding protein